MALDSKFTLNISAALTKALDLLTSEGKLAIQKVITLTSGTGANQADKVFSDTRTIAASGTDSLDLAGGGLLDALGDAFGPARIKAVYVFAASANTNNVNFTRPATNGVPLFLAVSSGLPVRPGGVLIWIAPDATGVAVTAATADLIDLVNSAGGTSVTYDILIIGASA